MPPKRLNLLLADALMTLVIGSPGSGRTMIPKRLPTILPRSWRPGRRGGDHPEHVSEAIHYRRLDR